jgi:hypothetical protein
MTAEELRRQERKAREAREALEYSASIALAFLTGYLLTHSLRRATLRPGMGATRMSTRPPSGIDTSSVPTPRSLASGRPAGTGRRWARITTAARR